MVTAAELIESAYREALAASPALFGDTFLQRGKQLQIGANRWVGGHCDYPSCMSTVAFLL